MAETPQPRRALQCGPPQCPECLGLLDLTIPRRGTPEREAILSQDTRVIQCDVCEIDLVVRQYL